MKTFLGWGAVLVVACCTTVWAFQVEPEKETKSVGVIRASRFELVDDQGRVRIEMRMDEGSPVVALKDEDGKDRVLVFHQPDVTGVYLKDATEETRVGLAQFPHGGGLAMHGEAAKGAAVYVLMNKQARLDIYDEDGTLTNRWPESPK